MTGNDFLTRRRRQFTEDTLEEECNPNQAASWAAREALTTAAAMRRGETRIPAAFAIKAEETDKDEGEA
ncbi:MAG: hypothetical protein Q4G30_08520 [Actinomycetaceae bacterium]|nr:hypothetical protein [Actinomycetaceae bacterium]